MMLLKFFKYYGAYSGHGLHRLHELLQGESRRDQKVQSLLMIRKRAPYKYVLLIWVLFMYSGRGQKGASPLLMIHKKASMCLGPFMGVVKGSAINTNRA